MINLNIKCTKPRFILNPNLLTLLTMHRKYCMNGVLYNVSNYRLTLWKYDGLDYFRHFIPQLSQDNINNFGVVDKDTGELLPIYLCVPCGKCKPCKYKKSLDWRVRCICESATSKCSPLFFTLTYDNYHLPKNGVNKDDIQNFMKRLRARLNYYGHNCDDLRYFVVAEYGSNTFRPHYHGLFWNFPYFDRFIDKIDIIQDCWSNGFIQVSPAKDLSGAYCMKYMFKDNTAPVGNNDTFFLSSRKTGGLGIKWLQDNFDYYRQFPQQTSIKVRCLDGEIKELPMPLYFQRKLFPSLSGLIPIKVRRALDLFLNYRFMAQISEDYCRKFHIQIRHKKYDSDLLFGFMSQFGLIDDNYDLGNVYNYFSFVNTDILNNIHDKEFIKHSFVYYHSLECENAKVVLDWIGNDAEDARKHYQDILDIIDIGKRHKEFADAVISRLPEVDMKEYLVKLDEIMAKSLQKEIF